MQITLLDHPLGSHLLARLRDKSTEPSEYRRHAQTLGTLLALEATRDLAIARETVETPLEAMEHRVIGQSLAAVPILRAGLSMLEPVLELFPNVAVGYVGLERDHTTAQAKSYYCKLPVLAGRYCLCLDPMLATGGSACQAIRVMKDAGADTVVMVSVVAAPEGVRRLNEEHPDVKIVAGALDRELNDKKYILPGLGDYGDRLYGT